MQAFWLRETVSRLPVDSADDRWTTDLFSLGRSAIDGLNLVRFGEISRWAAHDSEDRVSDSARMFLCVGHRRDYMLVAEEIGDVLVVVVEIVLEAKQDFVRSGRRGLIGRERDEAVQRR